MKKKEKIYRKNVSSMQQLKINRQFHIQLLLIENNKLNNKLNKRRMFQQSLLHLLKQKILQSMENLIRFIFAYFIILVLFLLNCSLLMNHYHYLIVVENYYHQKLQVFQNIHQYTSFHSFSIQVLDLDETLVHCSMEINPAADLIFPVLI